jgi:hypothetical protein
MITSCLIETVAGPNQGVGDMIEHPSLLAVHRIGR